MSLCVGTKKRENEQENPSHMAEQEQHYNKKDEEDDYSSSDSDSEVEEEEEDEKRIKHYSSKQKILLIGDGDFSFSVALARAFGYAGKMVATSLDTLEKIEVKYRNGGTNVMELQERGCVVLHGVDAKEMSQHFFLKTHRFDRIVYNFPHVGFHFPEDSPCQIQMNKTLVKDFMRNAKSLLRREGGEIHVTHKHGDPYDDWHLQRKAEKIGLVLFGTYQFHKADYPGYDNKRAHGPNPDQSFPLGPCSTYVFKLNT